MSALLTKMKCSPSVNTVPNLNPTETFIYSPVNLPIEFPNEVKNTYNPEINPYVETSFG
jgi:hypothetical protein